MTTDNTRKELEDLKTKLDNDSAMVRKLEMDYALMRVELKNLKDDYNKTITEIEEEKKRIRTGWNRFFWLIGGTFIASFLHWVTKGGLNIQ